MLFLIPTKLTIVCIVSRHKRQPHQTGDIFLLVTCHEFNPASYIIALCNVAIPDLGQLSVKAQMKPLSKPRSQPSLQDPIAKYPPVCFRVNARPPDHHLYYFAYGMDMNPDRFSTYIKRDVDRRLWGLLFGFHLKFNKTGADADGGCFPNIEFNPYSSVEGCLYVITEDELLVLDKCVGFPENLERIVLPVWMLNCAEPDDLGIAQYCVAALTYVAKDQCTRQEGSTEMCSDYALDQCLRCSDLLTPAYREHMRGKKLSAVTTA
ncbi:hypothetical protein LSAT2_010223 [Lamellibrachia satsuma]|nr:hypothetical protein LSAT2_010223 [Lamellibrachia satsuma]